MSRALKIKIFGVGGGGCNGVDYMLENKKDFLEYVQINTDAQSLKNNKADVKIHIGKELTKGLGAGAIPEIGSKSLVENKDEIIKELEDVKMIFITSGMGGGTGTGAAPELARLAKERGILTISIVTKPFAFEGRKRLEIAEEGIEKLHRNSDLVVIIPNQRLVDNHPDKILEDAFAEADSVLRDGVSAIVDLLNIENNPNVKTFKAVDFKSLEDSIKNAGLGVLGVGEVEDQKGDPEAVVSLAFSKAIESDMLDISIAGSKYIFMQITTSITDGISNKLIGRLIEELKRCAGTDNQPEYALKFDGDIPKGTVRISIVATGYNKDRQELIKTTNEYDKEIKAADITKKLDIDISIF